MTETLPKQTPLDIAEGELVAAQTTFEDETKGPVTGEKVSDLLQKLLARDQLVLADPNIIGVARRGAEEEKGRCELALQDTPQGKMARDYILQGYLSTAQAAAEAAQKEYVVQSQQQHASGADTIPHYMDVGDRAGQLQRVVSRWEAAMALPSLAPAAPVVDNRPA